MTKLVCKRVKFFSEQDELRFFAWIESISGVQRWEGVSDEIHIFVRSRLSDRSKHELWGLFRRYQIPVRQLTEFELVPSYWKDKAWTQQ
jgi:hypothetical protein